MKTKNVKQIFIKESTSLGVRINKTTREFIETMIANGDKHKKLIAKYEESCLESTLFKKIYPVQNVRLFKSIFIVDLQTMPSDSH